MEQQRFNTNATRKCGQYLRLSSDDGQSGESSSIKTQKAILARYYLEQGFEIYEICTELEKDTSTAENYRQLKATAD